MEHCVQRCSVVVTPATDQDIQWIGDQFDADEDTWRMFGYETPARTLALTSYFSHPSIIGIIRKAGTDQRIGFAMLFRSAGEAEVWQFGYSIPDRRHRNAFSALFTVDAVAHYAFDHVGVERIDWSVRQDNAPALAVIRRVGYQPRGERNEACGVYLEYAVDRAAWQRRRARLERTSPTPFQQKPWDGEPHLLRALAQMAAA